MELTEKWKLTIQNNTNVVVKGNQISYRTDTSAWRRLIDSPFSISHTNSRKNCFVGIGNVLPAGQKLSVPGSDHQDFTVDFLLG